MVHQLVGLVMAIALLIRFPLPYGQILNQLQRLFQYTASYDTTPNVQPLLATLRDNMAELRNAIALYDGMANVSSTNLDHHRLLVRLSLDIADELPLSGRILVSRPS